jgi:hypothetical protein
MVEEFSLDRLKVPAGRETNEEPRARLVRRGQDTGTVVPGAVLEAQIALEDGWLLFITHDAPFEEVLDIVLLDRSCRTVDMASLFWPYTTGTFRNLTLASKDTVVFDFFGHHRWRVKLFERPRFRLPLPLLVEPIGVHRKFGFKRHFAVGELKEAA